MKNCLDCEKMSLKEKIVKFIQDYYKQTGEAPSVNIICKHFKKEGLNRGKFYETFSASGILEACELAKVPIPENRIRRTKKARKTKETTKKEDENKLDPDGEHAALKAEVQQYQAIETKQNEIKKLHLEKSKTQKGLQDIFSSPENMVKFAIATVPAYTIKKLKMFCEERYGINNGDLKDELAMAIGAYTPKPLKFYEENYSNIPLDEYMIKRIDWYIDYWREEDRKKDLQQQFKDHWRTKECSKCDLGRQFWKIDPVNGLLHCECGSIFEPKCLSCWQQKQEEIPLKFSDGVYQCPQCDLTFEMPGLTKKEKEEVEERQRKIEAQRLAVKTQQLEESLRELEKQEREERAWAEVWQIWNRKFVEVQKEAAKKREEYMGYYKQIENLKKLGDALNIPFGKQMALLAAKRLSWPEPYKTECQFTREEKLQIILLEVPFYTTRARAD